MDRSRRLLRILVAAAMVAVLAANTCVALAAEDASGFSLTQEQADRLIWQVVRPMAYAMYENGHDEVTIEFVPSAEDKDYWWYYFWTLLYESDGMTEAEEGAAALADPAMLFSDAFWHGADDGLWKVEAEAARSYLNEAFGTAGGVELSGLLTDDGETLAMPGSDGWFDVDVSTAVPPLAIGEEGIYEADLQVSRFDDAPSENWHLRMKLEENPGSRFGCTVVSSELTKNGGTKPTGGFSLTQEQADRLVWQVIRPMAYAMYENGYDETTIEFVPSAEDKDYWWYYFWTLLYESDGMAEAEEGAAALADPAMLFSDAFWHDVDDGLWKVEAEAARSYLNEAFDTAVGVELSGLLTDDGETLAMPGSDGWFDVEVSTAVPPLAIGEDGIYEADLEVSHFDGDATSESWHLRMQLEKNAASRFGCTVVSAELTKKNAVEPLPSEVLVVVPASIREGITVAAYLEGLASAEGANIVTADGSDVQPDALVYTGMKLQVPGAEPRLIAVRGDLTGTGRYSLTQLVRMSQLFRDGSEVTSPTLNAADFTDDGRFTLTDLAAAAAQLIG